MAARAAIEISAQARQYLDSWQKYVLYRGLGQTEQGRWAAREVACVVPRQNGKGAIIEARELAGLFVYKERLIIHTAHRFPTSEVAFQRMMALCRSTPDLDRQVKHYWTGDAKKGIETRDGCFLRFMARTKDSVRGLTANCVIIDEAYGLSDEEKSALGYTVSAVPNHQIWYFSTPPLSAADSKPLFRLRERAEKADPRLAYFDWGAEEGADLDDIEVYYATNPALGIRIELDTPLAERANDLPEAFGRERLGIWPSLASQHVVEPNLWQSRADPDSEPGEKLALAVDVSPSRKTSIAMASVRPDGKTHLELIINRSGTDWVPGALKALRDKHNPVAIALDVAGPGGNLLLELERVGIRRSENGSAPRAGELVLPSARDAAASCTGLVDAIAAGSVVHLDQVPLNLALANAKTRSLGDSWAWARKSTSVDISPLVAVTLAKWAYELRADAIEPEYAEPSIFFL